MLVRRMLGPRFMVIRWRFLHFCIEGNEFFHSGISISARFFQPETFMALKTARMSEQSDSSKAKQSDEYSHRLLTAPSAYIKQIARSNRKHSGALCFPIYSPFSQHPDRAQMCAQRPCTIESQTESATANRSEQNKENCINRYG